MKIKFASVRALKDNVGRFTAVMAMNEICCIEFMKGLPKGVSESEEIFQKCKENGIILSRLFPEEFRNRRFRYYVAQLHEAIEAFCVDFREDFEACFPKRKWARLTPEERRASSPW